MKALKVVGIVVGVVAVVATAGAALFPATALSAGGFLGMSAATLATIGAVAGLAGAAIGIAGALLAPKPKFSTAGNPLQFQTNPQSGLPYAIGRTRMSGVRIHADTYDASSFASESKQDVLSFGVLLSAGGEIEEIETFRADKQTVTFDGSTGAASGSFANYMAQKVSLGVAGASALALAFGGGNFPGWTTDHKLSGITHALWDLRYDETGEVYGAGVPEPEWIGKWVKAYDPRLDSTYPGGSGSHRALDETTYEWTANPALHALTWALGRWQNSKRTLGIGAPVANIRVADFVEAANVADANGWVCGGVEWSTDSKWTTLKRMLQAGGAEPTMTGAMIGCRVNTPRVSIATVTADKLLDSASFPTTRSRRDRFNGVIPRYRSEDHDWEIISGELIQVAAYVTEDGEPRTKEIDFPLVQHETGGAGNDQAGELAAYEIVNSREAGPWRFTVGPEYIGVKTGDVITLDVPDEGIDEQPVLVRKRAIDPATFKITFEVETETEAKHAYALGQTAVPPPTYSPTAPDLTPPTPDAALWDLTAELTGDVLPSLRVTGACEFPGADSVLIQYGTAGGGLWQSLGAFDAATPVDHVIAAVAGGTSYEARVRYKSGNRVSPWLTLGPVTTPDFDLVADFTDIQNIVNDQNNRNGTAISAATIASDGTAVDHTIRTDGSADLSFEWSWSGTEADIDGFEVLAFSTTSSSAYTVGSTPAGELVTRIPPNRRAFLVLGVPANLYYTFGVRPYREVDDDVNAAGVIYGSWVKPSLAAENPYRPSANVAFAGDLSGTINSVAVTTITAVVNSSTGFIASGKVISDSIADGAINIAGYDSHDSNIFLSTSDGTAEQFFNSDFDLTSGDVVTLRIVIPYNITVSNPTEGSEYYVNIHPYIREGAGGTRTYGEDAKFSEIWNEADGTGTKYFGVRYAVIECRLTAPATTNYYAGYDLTTPSTNGCDFVDRRYLKEELPVAAQ